MCVAGVSDLDSNRRVHHVAAEQATASPDLICIDAHVCLGFINRERTRVVKFSRASRWCFKEPAVAGGARVCMKS